MFKCNCSTSHKVNIELSYRTKIDINFDCWDYFSIGATRKAAGVMAKHPTRIDSGADAKKLVSLVLIYKFCNTYIMWYIHMYKCMYMYKCIALAAYTVCTYM